MSSDIENSSSIEESDCKMDLIMKNNNGNLAEAEITSSCVDDSDSQVCGIPSYANLSTQNEIINMNGQDEANKSPNNSVVTRRDKNRNYSRYNRKSRSRERPRAPPIGANDNSIINNSMNSSLTSTNNTTNFNYGPSIDSERIRERERELEKIHRRSRELMLSPRIVETSNTSRSREASGDRLLNTRYGVSSPSGVALDGWKPVPPPSTTSIPPPLPPRIQSPNSGTSTPTNGHSRYGNSFSPSYHHPALPPHHPHQRFAQGNSAALRRRVQSPNRRDFAQHPRDFRSPMKIVSRGSYFDEDEDSGADSLGNDLGMCHGHYNCGGFHQHFAQCSHSPRPPSGHGSSSMALVPYEQSNAYCNRQNTEWCCRPSNAFQRVPDVEERLLQLEGDKDTLHLQVALLSDQLENQTEKISDLEKVLDEKKDVLRKTEDVLQQEMLTRSSLETRKLELMSEISNLKLRQTAVENENSELKKKLSNLTLIAVASGIGSRGGKTSSNNNNTSSRGLSTINNGVDSSSPVMTLPPSGAKFTLNSASSNTIRAFGTMPRTGARNRAHQKQQHKVVTKNNAGLMETHFNDPPNDIADKEQNDNDNDTNNYPAGRLTNSHGGSAPSLAPNEGSNTVPRARHQSVERVLVTNYSSPNSNQRHLIASKPKGLKKILGRMRRSNSGTIHDDKKRDNDENDLLRRGGLRASAGSRFAAWIGPSESSNSYPDPNLPFRQWKVETICSWLDNLGLYMYNAEVRKHIKIGEQMLAMSSHDLENRLGMRSSLHRKKLLLALQVKQEPGSCSDLPGRLDHQWVVRWLDDVGLPQYKDAFLEARIDGRVLNLLTVEDLFQLKVTNLLHHLSIKRGVEVLRSNNFEPACLKRRASPEERDRSSLPIEVSLWTNHRVMEWLRHVDLAEYAPNLRGSGVHGALLINEPRFNSDLLASLLSIPTNKTLLRRHLSVHFRDLVGREVMLEKRSIEDDPNHQALTPTTKVKPQKRSGSQFSLRRRKFRPDEMDFEELVCPLDDGTNNE